MSPRPEDCPGGARSSRHHPYLDISFLRRRRQQQQQPSQFEMGQKQSSCPSWTNKCKRCLRNPYKHHLDPISLNAQSLGGRKHMFGDTDLDIVVKEHRFPVHRYILTEQSLYFKSMFGAFEERDKSSVELKLELIEPALMGQVVHYMYSNRVTLTPKNAQDLLGLATYLQMEQLQRECVHYMRARIDRANCVQLFLYTQTMGPLELQTHAEDFILAHFESVVAKTPKDFAVLSKEQLLRLISSERLLVSSEGAVYKAVLQWVGHDPAQRQAHLPGLLEHVHFPLMSLNEVEQCRRDQRVKKTRNLAIAFEEARRYFDQGAEGRIRYWTDKQKPPRWPKIFVVMRMYWKNLPMEYYDFRTRQWQRLAEVKSWRSCSALVAHAGCVYLVGGEEVDPDSPTGSRTVNRVTRYDCERQKWSSAPSMNLARRWAAAVVMGSTLYVIGGIGGRGGTYERRLDSVECLDLSVPKARWKPLASMSTARSSHTVEVLDGKIYVVGGGDGKDWLCTSEVYNPKKNKWSLISNLRTKRWKCGLCVLNGSLYAIGGMDSPNAGFWGAPLRSAEVYSPATDTWSEVAPMHEARFGSAVVAYQGRMYVSGGFGVGKKILSSTECFDPDTNKWEKLAPMKTMCGFVGGVLVDRPVHFEQAE